MWRPPALMIGAVQFAAQPRRPCTNSCKRDYHRVETETVRPELRPSPDLPYRETRMRWPDEPRKPDDHWVERYPNQIMAVAFMSASNA